MSEIILNNNGILAKVELDVEISTAKAYPRNIDTFLQRAEKQITLDEEIAEECFYILPGRDTEGNKIEGGSIRLAEIIASCWGNLRIASRIVENDGKFITTEGVSWDLETNVKWVSQLQLSIKTKEGKLYSSNMQSTTANAGQAKCRRNAIFQNVGKAYVNYLTKIAKKCAVGDQKTLSTKRRKIFDRFKSMQIDENKILGYFKKSNIEEINLEDIEILIGIGTAIKEGTLNIDNAFNDKPEQANSSKSEELKDWINSKSTASQ